MARFGELSKWRCSVAGSGVISPLPRFVHCNNFRPKHMSHSIAAATAGTVAAHDLSDAPAKVGFWALTLGSIGVVYGDIGTSPLYALREAVLAATGAGTPSSEPVVLGILSLIIWALLLVVTAKYV